MRNPRRISLKSFAGRAAGGRGAKAFAALSLVLLTGCLAFAAQQGGTSEGRDVPLEDRFERAVKVKEPEFKTAGRLRRKNEQENYFLQGWRSGDELVSATTYELASAEEAAEMLKRTLNAPLSVPVQTAGLEGLGEEAYMRANSPYGKEGQAHLLFRKGNFVIVMSATSPGLAERFARHMADEIGKR